MSINEQAATINNKVKGVSTKMKTNLATKGVVTEATNLNTLADKILDISQTGGGNQPAVESNVFRVNMMIALPDITNEGVLEAFGGRAKLRDLCDKVMAGTVNYLEFINPDNAASCGIRSNFLINGGETFNGIYTYHNLMFDILAPTQLEPKVTIYAFVIKVHAFDDSIPIEFSLRKVGA